MQNIFVFCASARKARLNFQATVETAVDTDVVLSCFPTERHEELLSWKPQTGGFYLWGIKPGKRVLTMLSKMKTGDCVLGFFNFKYQSVARLVGRTQCPDLAAKLWGNLEWSEIIFMDKPRLVAVEAKKLQPYLCSTYRGAVRISSERVDKIVKDFGSLEAFVSKNFI